MRFQAVSQAHRRFLDHPELPLAVAIIFALTIRLLMSVGTNGILWPDSAAYYRSAALMAKYGNFHWHEIYRTPLYPMFMALIIWPLGQNALSGAVIIGLQRILGILSVVLVYKIARRSFGPATAFYSAVLFGAHTLQLYYETTVHTETLFTFLLLLTVSCAGRFFSESGAKQAALVGLLCGLATLARPIAQFLLLLVLAIFFCKQGFSRRSLLAGLSSLAVFVATLLPWMATNKAYYGFFGVSQDLGLNLFHRIIDVEKIPPVSQSAYPRVQRIWHAVKGRQAISYFQVYHALLREKVRKVKADRMMAGFALETLQQESWRYLPQYAQNSVETFLRFFFDSRNSQQFCGAAQGPYLCTRNTLGRSEKAFSNNDEGLHPRARVWVKRYFNWTELPMALICGLGLVGFLLALRRWRDSEPTTLLMTALSLYFAFLTGIFNIPEDRFRLPVDGLLIAGAVFTVVKLVEYCKAYGTSSVVSSPSRS